jgi:guanylate kinase
MSDVSAPDLDTLFAGRTEAFALVVSGPSGVGKTSICSEVIRGDSRIEPVVTTTTRGLRPGEVDGTDYHFVTDAAFDALLTEDAFLEHANVHGSRYGTTRQAFQKSLDGADVVLLEIDVQGAQTLRAILDDRCAEIFILPPSLQELRARLAGRKSEGEDAMRVRMNNAVEEMAFASTYDYVIVNHDIKQAILDIESVVKAERSRTVRQQALLQSLDI